MLARFTRLFPLWALLVSVLAVLEPQWFLPAQRAIVPLLMLVMLGMGLTLAPQDFLDVARRPMLVAIGCLLHFTVMPLAALLISKALQLPPEYTVGMVLVGATSSGTASNVVNYLARGNVALAVSLTIASTLLAVPLLPAITWVLVGQSVPVPASDMMLTVLQVAVVPVVFGMVLRVLFARGVERLQPLMPAMSLIVICLIIAIIVALNRTSIASAGMVIALAVILHNGIGLACGYALARALRVPPVDARTIAIEVGMQNSGLAVALAVKYFAPAAALPGALFSVWHNVSGSLLAGYWARRSSQEFNP